MEGVKDDQVELYVRVRRACMVEGMSTREAARVFGLHRDTVRKMLAYSMPPGYRRQTPPRRPKLEPYTGVIDRILEEDHKVPRKQRHTAKRIFERLRDEHGFGGQYTIVKDYVRERRRRTKEMFVPLSHAPGHAQCDFGEARVIIGGVEQKAHYFVLDLPHSDRCFIKAYPAETTEAFQNGHVSAFSFLSGVPQSILYDNTRLAVARILGDGRRKGTRAFTDLQSHYLFEDRFGRPGKGNDKGKVEGMVGYVRRNFLVPVPSFESFEALNAHLERRCLARMDARLRGHTESIGQRMERDLEALTRREVFLERMERLIPWEQLEELIRPYYPTAGRGRRPYPLSAMLRIHCVQLFYNLSDPGMEDLLYEVESVRRFMGLRLSEALPDETTVLHFRHLLEEHGLGMKLFEEINRHLEAQGLRLREGTIMDATLIAAPTSTKNKAKERDPEMHQTKKGNEWYFGMKAHIGVDARTGMVHRVMTTPANVNDLTEAHGLLHGEERCVWADAGYQGVEKRAENAGMRIEWRVAMRPSLRRGLDPESTEGLREKRKASVRAKVEHPFLYVKRHFGYAKVRYRGLYKNTQRLAVLFGLTNLLKAEGYLAAA